ncbi:MAG TPA: alpha-amylase, partial [Opitutae bacterium]|nr:alpha-amylase [Opitutae bacterium]
MLASAAYAAPTVPDWAKDVVWYQIFPERFNNGDRSNDPTRASLSEPQYVTPNWQTTAWESEWFDRADWEKEMSPHFDATLHHRRYGGDLQGVIDKLDYLKELGVTGIYFNPIFYADSLHKYDGNSFHHIDPHFGPDPEGDLKIIEEESSNPRSWQWTAADKRFLELLKEAKARDIRVIIDGVWNHTGRDFFAFADIRTRFQKSRYARWYDIKQFDDPRTARNEFDYNGWYGFKSLPEFANDPSDQNLASGPKRYVFNASKRWMDPNGDGDPSDGIDGWRLDVAEEVPHGFWQEWHAYIREINPEVFTSAEIWGSAGQYLRETHFSSAMNYRGFAIPLKGWLIDGKITASQFAERLNNERNSHGDNAYILQNLVDSHDTQRIASAIANRSSFDHY